MRTRTHMRTHVHLYTHTHGAHFGTCTQAHVRANPHPHTQPLICSHTYCAHIVCTNTHLHPPTHTHPRTHTAIHPHPPTNKHTVLSAVSRSDCRCRGTLRACYTLRTGTSWGQPPVDVDDPNYDEARLRWLLVRTGFRSRYSNLGFDF